MASRKLKGLPKWFLEQFPFVSPDVWNRCDRPSEWRRFDRGLVHRSATIGADLELGKKSFIGPGTVVGNGTRIKSGVGVLTNVRIGNEVFIDMGCSVANNATLEDSCEIGWDVVIHAGVRIGERAVVNNGALLMENSSLGYRAAVGRAVRIDPGACFSTSPLYIQGSRDDCYHCGPGVFGIGGEIRTVAEWSQSLDSYLVADGYTTEQIIEYRRYMDLLIVRDKAVFPNREP